MKIRSNLSENRFLRPNQIVLKSHFNFFYFAERFSCFWRLNVLDFGPRGGNLQVTKRTKYLFWKTISFVVLLCFSVTTVAWSNPTFRSQAEATQSHPLSKLKTLSLPEQLGRIEEVYIPEGVNPDSPFIVYLQDAHADLGAQENIAKLARELDKELKIEAILKEGGSGEADLTELRGFPDQKIKDSVTHFWMEEAVLSGIERETIIGPKKYRFFGIEDQAAHEAGGKYFLKTQNNSLIF